MKINLNPLFTSKALAAFAVFMACLYLLGGAYFLVLGVQHAYWQGVLTGSVFVLYGSFRAYRTYQKYRNENS